MKSGKRIWSLLFSLVMLAFVVFFTWHLFASSSLKSQTKEAADNLAKQKDLLDYQQREEAKALEEIQYYQNMMDDLQPEYDVIISKKAYNRALGARQKELGIGAQESYEFDNFDDFEYEEVDDEDEELGEEDWYDTY